jgi:hypothetical protein
LQYLQRKANESIFRRFRPRGDAAVSVRKSRPAVVTGSFVRTGGRGRVQAAQIQMDTSFVADLIQNVQYYFGHKRSPSRYSQDRSSGVPKQSGPIADNPVFPKRRTVDPDWNLLIRAAPFAVTAVYSVRRLNPFPVSTREHRYARSALDHSGRSLV